MSRKRRCICSQDEFPFCHEQGAEATVSLPQDGTARSAWLRKIGREPSQYHLKDGRVCLSHFNQENLKASTGSQPSITCARVWPSPDAEPSECDETMRRESKGAFQRALKAEAIIRKLLNDRNNANQKAEKLQKANRILTENLERTKAKLQSAKEALKARPKAVFSYYVLETMHPERAKVLCGFPGIQSLLTFYDAINVGGAADDIRFQDGDVEPAAATEGKENASIKQRKKVFGGVNGVFFTLLVLRTALPLRIASSLFGVHETTGGRAFTTWMSFLRGSLRPFVRLPTIAEVISTAPIGWEGEELSRVIAVLDATEVESCRSLQIDAAYATSSLGKDRPTGKVVVGVTPGGTICHISNVHDGGVSDAEVVKLSGLIGHLRAGGFANQGFSIMADRGFSPLAEELTREGLNFAVSPLRRKGPGASQPILDGGRNKAHLRVHVERAIGTLKEWRYLRTKFGTNQTEQIPMAFELCAALVNMTRQPLTSPPESMPS